MAYRRFVRTGMSCPPGMATVLGDGTPYGYPGQQIYFCEGEETVSDGYQFVPFVPPILLPGPGFFDNPATPPITGPVTDKACGTCRPPASAPSGPSPTQPGAPTPRQTQQQGWPWWVFILLAMVVAEVVHDG